MKNIVRFSAVFLGLICFFLCRPAFVQAYGNDYDYSSPTTTTSNANSGGSGLPSNIEQTAASNTIPAGSGSGTSETASHPSDDSLSDMEDLLSEPSGGSSSGGRSVPSFSSKLTVPDYQSLTTTAIASIPASGVASTPAGKATLNYYQSLSNASSNALTAASKETKTFHSSSAGMTASTGASNNNVSTRLSSASSASEALA